MIITSRVEASADDCLVRWDGAEWDFFDTYASLFIGYNSATNLKTGGGMNFRNVFIPKGSTINSAKITFQANTSKSLTTVNAKITGYKVDNSAAFTNIADYAARRGTVVGGANDNYITSQVTWANLAAQTEDSTYDTPDFADIVQELLDNDCLVSGVCCIFVDDHAGESDAEVNNCRHEDSYDTDPNTSRPLLTIDFTPLGGTILNCMAGGLL